MRRFGTLLSDETKALREYNAGVRVVHQEMGWNLYEPTNGAFSTAYKSAQTSKLGKFRSARMDVVLGIGLQYPPNWAYNDFANSRYVNQFGRASGLNLTFNQKLRTQAEQYIAKVHADIDLNNYCAVRIGSGSFIETLYPGMDDGGSTNCYWAWDINAGGGADRPSTIPKRPHATWKPGETSITKAQVGEWLDWYLEALVDGIEWQIAYYKSLGFTGFFHVLMPGLGTRPREYTGERDAYCNGLVDGNRTLGRGAVYDRIIDKIADKVNLVVYESGLADGSGVPVDNLPTAGDTSVSYLTDPAVTLWSGTRWKVFNASRYGLAKAGENPGQVDSTGYGLSMMRKADEMADAGGLDLVMWAHDFNLYNGVGGVTLADYAAAIHKKEQV